MDLIQKLLNCINRCFVPKLAKNYDESNDHPEIELRNRCIEKNFQSIVEHLGSITISDLKKHPKAVADMFILYKELTLDCPWNMTKTRDIAKQLNTFFEMITSVHLNKILYRNDGFDVNEVFDKCLESIHLKVNCDTFRMYPAQIEVYMSILLELKEYNVELMPTKLFPITLLLIEDYSLSNKKKGLQCCSTLLQLLEIKDFHKGNYYEVIYRSLKKNLVEKDVDIVNLTHSCLLALLKILPDGEKGKMLDELYTLILEQLSYESNLYKKAACFNFTSSIIQWHRENCVNRKDFKQIVCDSLDICTNDAVSAIILSSLLQCLEKWITYCWPIWKFKMDHKMLASLFKVLYTCKEDQSTKQIHKIIVTLFNLCTSSEQECIIKSFERKREAQSEEFMIKIKEIKKDLVLSEN